MFKTILIRMFKVRMFCKLWFQMLNSCQQILILWLQDLCLLRKFSVVFNLIRMFHLLRTWNMLSFLTCQHQPWGLLLELSNIWCLPYQHPSPFLHLHHHHHKSKPLKTCQTCLLCLILWTLLSQPTKRRLKNLVRLRSLQELRKWLLGLLEFQQKLTRLSVCLLNGQEMFMLLARSLIHQSSMIPLCLSLNHPLTLGTPPPNFFQDHLPILFADD